MPITTYSPSPAAVIIEHVERRLPVTQRSYMTFSVDSDNANWARLEMPKFGRTVEFVQESNGHYTVTIVDYDEDGNEIDRDGCTGFVYLSDLPKLAAQPKRPEAYRTNAKNFSEWFERANTHGPNLNPPLWDYEEISARTPL